MDSSKFKEFISGKAKRRVYGTYLLSLGALCITFFVTSGVLYNVPFTFRVACVSDLGNPTLNVKGWWVFSLLFIIAGPALVPHFLYIYRNIYPVTKGLTNGMLFFLLLSCVGMTGVGIVNETTWPPHVFFAVLIFGGTALAMGCSLAIFIRKIQLKHSWPRPIALVIFVAFIFTFIILMAGEFAFHAQGTVSNLNLAEWYAVFGIFTWIFGVFFLVSGESKQA